MASVIQDLQRSLTDFVEVENAMMVDCISLDNKLLQLMRRETAAMEKLAAAEASIATVVRRRMIAAKKGRRPHRKRKGTVRRERVFFNRTDAFELNDEEFTALYCLNKECVLKICNDLHDALEPKVNPRKNVFSVKEKVLCALRFLVSGFYQNTVKKENEIAMSQRSASRSINTVISAINEILFERYIKFPTDPEEHDQLKRKFMELSGFPGVIGVIGSTHVALVAPPINGVYKESSFQNRKGYYSLNVQLMCDSDLMIRDICADFPGSVRDSTVLRSSPLYQFFNSDKFKTNGEAWLVGDNNYPLEPWLLTPVEHPEHGSPEQKYNQHHSLVLRAAEKCITLLKSRFRCLLRSRPLYYSPATVAKLVTACAVLHNICVQSKLPEPHEMCFADDGFAALESETAGSSPDGGKIQVNIIKSYFS